MKKILLYLTILFASLQMFSQTVTITESAGWLESAFVKWQPVSGAQSYNVYYSGNGITNQKIDNQLIRSYGTYFRADVPGLAAGSYTLTIKPVTASVEGAGTTTSALSVLAHDRNGFAFEGGRVPGGYKADGTPKTGAVILYITQNTKNTISMDITGASTNPCVGLQNILYAIKKGKDTRPFIIRLIGNITDMTVMEGGDITIENANNANSYLTLEGIGNDAVVNGMGVRLKSASNIEVSNLGLMNCNSTAGDNIGMQQDNDHIWVHNNDLFYGNAGSDADQIKGDGALDNKNSTYITMSYNHFWDSGKASLLGLSEGTTTGLYVTYHHNWFDHSDSRHPRVRYYSAHIYNNYFDGNAKYGSGSTLGSSLFVEGNYYRNSKNPMMTSLQGTDVWDEANQKNNAGTMGTFSGEAGGSIKAYNNTFDTDIATNSMRFVAYGDTNPLYNIAGKISSTVDFDAYVVTNRGDQVPSTVKSYSGSNMFNNFDTDAALYVKNLVPDSPANAKLKVVQYAGRVSGGDLKWTFDNSVDDKSYLVISGLKTALTNYTSSIVAIQGETAAAGNQTLVATTNNNNQAVSTGAAISNIVFTWGGDATDAAATGLPNGIVATKNTTAKTITLSGTPTETMEYTVTTSGSAGASASDSGTITVLPPSSQVLTSTSNNNNQTITVGSAITPIVFTWSGDATDADVSGLATGLGSVKDAVAKTITISGTPTNTGSATYTVITSGSAGTPVAVSGTITVNAVASGSQIHNFTASGKTSSFYTITGSMNSTAGTATYDGLDLTARLKIESATTITYTTTGVSTLTLVFDPAFTGKIKLNNVSSAAAVGGVITFSSVPAGANSITKGDTANLFYIKTVYDAVVSSPTISNFAVANKVVGDQAFALTAPTSNSNGAFTYTSSNTNVATISGNTVTIVGAGTATITANQAATATYTAGSITAILTVSAAAQAPTISNFTVASKTVGDQAFALTAPTSNSNGAFTYTSSDTNVATISGNTVTIVGAGSATITANQAGSATYTAGSITATLTVSAAAQTPTLSNFTVGGKTVGDQAFALTAPTSNSNGAFTYTSSNTNVATISGNTVTIVGAGTTTITANQAATSTYAAASILVTFTVSPASATSSKIDVWDFGAQQLDTNLYNNKLDVTTINAWYPGTVTAGSTSITMPVSFTTGALSWVGNSSDRLRTTNTALTRYDVNLASVLDYTGRVYCNGTPTLSSGVPTNRFMRITLDKDDEVTIVTRADADGGILNFVDENNSALQSDTFNMTATVGATSQAVFVAKSASTFKIYSANGKVSFYRISRKAASSSSVVLIAPALSNFTVGGKTVGDQAFALTAPTSNSNGAFTYTSSDTNVVTISGNTVTIVGVGTATITASQAATPTYTAGSISATLTVSAAAQAPTISNFTVASKTVGDQAFALTAPTSNSNGVFTYTSSDTNVATISGNTVTIVGAGTATITANQAATATYTAGSITATLTVSAAAQAPTISNFAVASKTVGDQAFALTAPTSNSNGAFTYTSSNTNVATISGNTVTIVGAGSATITANQAATATYTAGSITATLTVSSAAQAPTISNFSVASKTVGDQAFALTAPTSNSNGAFTYTSSDTNVATISGNTVTIVGAGSATITANQAATATYAAGSITATLTVSAASTTSSKIDVWDFGAQQLDVNLYNNKLDVAAINAWYPNTYVAGSANTTNVMPASFTAGDLGWVGGTNDRLRTSNTALTRYDANVGSGAAASYTGRIYINGSAQTGRYLSFNLKEDDELTVVANSDAAGRLNFVYLSDATIQSDLVETTATTTEYKFVAKKAGVYKIYDQVNKPSYYRIIRKAATYVTVSGSVDVTKAAGIPAGYSIVFTNGAGKSWNSVVSNGTYNAALPAGYTYSLSIANASGYVISAGDTFAVSTISNQQNVEITKITMFTITGNIVGLGSDIASLSLKYTPDPAANKTYVPVPVINTATAQYSVKLEADVQYTISGLGVNEYEISANKLTISSGITSDVTFSLKPKYKVTIAAPSLNATQLAKLGLKFTNLNETGVSYAFADITNINLRNGVYSVTALGLDEYPVALGLTSNLVISNAAVSKELTFKPVTNWSFDDKVIANGTTSYKGMLFTGAVVNEIAKGHLNASAGSTLSVPVSPNQKVTVTYYYAANFSIQGGTAVTTNSNSTGLFEKVDYVYTGTTAGNVVIAVNGTTYFTDVNVDTVVPYAPIITVGTDKDYQTINEALKAISKMVRTSAQRVTVVIDPGNYEEMIVVNSANVTFKNAATKPSIALKNKGVDIDANAVRITSYYGYGYSYYSQGNDNKWNAEVLAANKANNSYTYENVSGTTNGSYWDATAVIAANGFEAENIIFENSFNQYISKKESQDKVVMWTVGNKGLRPSDYGNTAVQNRSFVERAAAIGIANGVDKTILKNCRVVGRQDSFFGGVGSRVVVYKGAVMGAVDYIFGGMIGVFYKTDFVMNVSDVAGDASYLTAPQQSSGRGFLLYECKVTSAEPGVETASAYRAKPGYFGRPWAANTSEVVLYKTKIETSNFPGSEGLSLIAPEGWTNSLGGTSDNIYEFGTVEVSGVDNSAKRVSWSKSITTPVLADNSDITTFNFTKGTDGWDPIPSLEKVTSLPNNNFSVKVNSATCNGMQNGAITVASAENTLEYTVAINSTNITLNSALGYTKTIENLAAGVYNVCFSTPSISGYSQCFEVKIEEPAKIVVSSFVSKNSNTIKLAMSGSATYKVSLNGKDETVTASDYTAELKPGINTIAVSTDLECQGVYNETVFVSEDIQYFPNPTSGLVQVYVAGDDKEVNVRVFDFVGNKLFESVKSVASTRHISVDLSSYIDGLYMVQLEGKTVSKTFKIVKK